MTQPDLTIPKYPRPDVRRPELRDHDLVSDSELPALDPEALEDFHNVGEEQEVRAEIRAVLVAWARGKQAIEATAGGWSKRAHRDQLYRAQHSLLASLSHEARELMAEHTYIRVGEHTFVCVVGADGEVEVDTLSVLAL